ncbi:MAG: cold shock domain-containing protein [Candidatus Zophobacter franzmannii]|nr:cold shock domain-containing protein [Candidatus Zophobacter franzmannii]
MTGTVKWFNKNKGYGFILSEDNQEYFVHWKSIVTLKPMDLKVLEQEEKVEFDLMPTDKGTQAVNVMRTEVPNSSF